MKNARRTYPILISKQDTFSEFNGLLLSGLDKAFLMLYICKQNNNKPITNEKKSVFQHTCCNVSHERQHTVKIDQSVRKVQYYNKTYLFPYNE